MRSELLATCLSLLASAPIQCPRQVTPENAREETPGEALWQLAERHRQAGDMPARERTLRFLIERYPSSRFAQPARWELGIGDDAGRR